jgi:nucleotide-binding universal stress UspA family protein
MKGPVICGIDDSRTTRGAVAVARELARRYELPLLYVHVLDGDDGRRQRRPVAPTDAELALVGGHPADGLVAFAQERNASFVVVGNHGPRSSLLGSVSADVARRASCPVMVVPPSAVEPEIEGGIIRFGLGA